MTRQMEEVTGGESATIAGVVNDLKEKGYNIKEKVTGTNILTGIVLNDSEITMDKNETRILTYTLKYAEGTIQYFVEVEGKYYEITMENDKLALNTESTNLEDAPSIPVPIIETNKDGIITIEIGENGIITINSEETYGDVEIIISCAEKRATCTVTVTAPPPTVGEVEIPRTVEQEIPYSWEEIATLAGVIAENVDKITDDTEEVAVSINRVSDTLRVGDTTKINGKVVRILGFNHDELSDTEKLTAYGGGFDYAGISFEYVDALTTGQWNSEKTTAGGWGASVVRKSLNGTLFDNLPIRNYIKEVKKEYLETGTNANSMRNTNDFLWLLSCGEIWNNGYEGGSTRGYAKATEGKQYKFYKKINATYNIENYALSKPSNMVGLSSSRMFWLRSVRGNRDGYPCMLQYGSDRPFSGAEGLGRSIAPGFCI